MPIPDNVPHYGGDQGRLARAALALCLLLVAGACGTPFVKPAPVDVQSLREQATTKTEDGLRVSVAVPSESEVEAIFGIGLDQHGVQPLWLEIENDSHRLITFLPTGMDPEYFAPLEVAFLYKDSLTKEGHAGLADHIQALSLDPRHVISPGETTSGFVYLNPSDPNLVVEIDLLAHKWSRRFSFVVPVLSTEEAQQRIAALSGHYTQTEIVEIDDAATLRTTLEGLPCCTTNESGAEQSLPLNLVLIGEIEDLGPAFARRRYRYNPVSPAYLFGRVQDFSGHRTSRWIAPQPHTIRFWLTPLRYQGKSVWIGQVSTRQGGRFGPSDEETRRIEPDVDEARIDLVQDLLYSQAIAKMGFVDGVGPVAIADPREAADGSTYYTDGLRAVLVFGGTDVSLADIDFFDWESLVDQDRQLAN